MIPKSHAGRKKAFHAPDSVVCLLLRIPMRGAGMDMRFTGKARVRRAGGCALLVLVCLLLSAAGAASGRVFSAWSDPEGGPRVLSRKSSTGQVVLSIPGAWDLTRVYLACEGKEAVLIGRNRLRVTPEEPVDLSPFAGRQVQLYTEKGNSLGSLTVCQGSAVPAVFFTVDAGQLKKVNQSKNNVITEGRAVFQEADGTLSYQGELAHLKGRGNNTFSYAKKPYEFKLKKKASLAGLAKGKTWILLANAMDVSLLRNQIVLDLSRAVKLAGAVGCQPVDVWLNGIYNGLYLMTEKVQISSTRLRLRDLEEETQKVNGDPLSSYPAFNDKHGFLPILRGNEIPNDPEDITGGYIAVIEKPHRLRRSEKPGIRTERQLSVRIKEPTNPSRAQVEYFGRRVNDMHNAVAAEDGINPETGLSYTAYLDVTSFARKYLVEDLSKNYDAVSGSQYFYKDSDLIDPLIYAGPSWDYDLSFGNMLDRGLETTGNYIANVRVGPVNLYAQLGAHADFMEEVVRVWRQEFRSALAVLLGETASSGGPLRSLDEYEKLLRASAAMNEARWGAGTRVNPDAGRDFRSGVRALKSWVKKRIEYMDRYYGQEGKRSE